MADSHDDKTGAERRLHERYDCELSVDYHDGDNFLFASITNISEMGIFIRSEEPLAIGTALQLRFGGDQPLQLEGTVKWVNPVRPDGDNPNPGMGIQFRALSDVERERVVALVSTVAYLAEEPVANSAAS